MAAKKEWRRDWVGRRQGGLVVLSEVEQVGRYRAWLCRCDCGTEEIKLSSALNQGCYGCSACVKARAKQKISNSNTGRNIQHGSTVGARKGRRDPVYVIWQAIKQRCTNPQRNGYAYYGGRGIHVCEEWGSSFEAFRAYVGARPSTKHSIDRIDPEGNYEPGNVRWATRVQQNFNRRNTIRVEYMGETRTLYEWAQRLGIRLTLLQGRYRKGKRGGELFRSE